MAGYLKINGVTIKTPKKFTAGIQAVDGDSGRNAKGDMTRDYITTKRKMDLEWGALTDAEISPILKAVMSPFLKSLIPIRWKAALLRKHFMSAIDQLQHIPGMTNCPNGKG